jgi:hypothetical protein
MATATIRECDALAEAEMPAVYTIGYRLLAKSAGGKKLDLQHVKRPLEAVRRPAAVAKKRPSRIAANFRIPMRQSEPKARPPRTESPAVRRMREGDLRYNFSPPGSDDETDDDDQLACSMHRLTITTN